MNSGGMTGGIYRPLGPVQVDLIHDQALRLLEDVGMAYESGQDDLAALVAQAGCRVDHKASRIFFPPGIVKEMVARAPGEFTLYSRDGNNDLALGKDRVYAGTGGTTVNILDLDADEVRRCVVQDIRNVARIVEEMQHIHFFQNCCVPNDVPIEHYDLNIAFAAMLGTRKHVMFGCNFDQGLRDTYRMAARIVGSQEALRAKPVFSISACMIISPLKFCTQSTANVRTAAELGVPTTVTSAPMSGSTAPMTMAGTLLQTHAEVLAGITVHQLTRPGAPVLYGGLPAMAEMRRMGYQGGAIECGMMQAAMHQLSQRVDVPNYASSGLSDSKISDVQAGWEKAFTTGLAVMGGNNYIHHAAGMLESMQCVAYEMYVIDDEIIGQACKILQGISTTEDHLALDAIREVGPGGNYLLSPHTMRHLRSEYFQGNGVSDKSRREEWIQQGCLSARDRARAIARAILDSSPEPGIHPDIEKEIRSEFKIYL
ncbi:Trimethylamine methyltransferase family protein [Olavius algarvensis Delta 1 endosymbiont]|nr:Trimethylamine methyltransferase family protein [Olavius algarvensis Delta 1 endosymbiont]